MTYNHLTALDRDIISIELSKETSKKDIAELLCVHISTIYREIKRNVPEENKATIKYSATYYSSTAHTLYLKRKHDNVNASKFTADIKYIIEDGLKQQFSLETICGIRHKTDNKFPCYRTLYNYIKSGFIKLPKNYRLKLKKKKAAKKSQSFAKDANTKSIDQRPNYINNNKYFGHWELDLIDSAGNGGYIISFKERLTRYTLTCYIPTKCSKHVNKQLRKWFKKYPVYSITTDNGAEFNSLYKLKTATNKLEIYYAHPGSPHEKGAVEEFNKLLREFIKKKSTFNHKSIRRIKYYTNHINNRPMKVMNYVSPKFCIKIMMNA